VRVVDERTFFPAPRSPAGLDAMLVGDTLDVDGALTLHLCAHLWWRADRTDCCTVHAGMLTAEHVRSVDTTYNRLARPFVPDLDLW
jgi:hypothetical protein